MNIGTTRYCVCKGDTMSCAPLKVSTMLDPSWRTDKRSLNERGYGAKWQKARHTFLDAYPLCVRCDAKSRTCQPPPSTTVCLTTATLSSSGIGEIQREERSGLVVHGTDRDGRPLDPAHP